jgi:hypothetical protein
LNPKLMLPEPSLEQWWLSQVAQVHCRRQLVQRFEWVCLTHQRRYVRTEQLQQVINLKSQVGASGLATQHL